MYFQIHFGEEIAQLHLCSCVHRAIYDCHRIRFRFIIRSDNGPCYNSKEFQQFLQCYSITHQTSSPNHPRFNGFAERMVGVAQKLMNKAGKEGKPSISGLFDYRVTSQSGSIASSLQLMTQCTPREKSLPQLPSALDAPEMHQTCQELIKRQENSKPERKYQELLPGTPVWVQHWQNATWEPAIVVNQCAPNSYWIMQENGAEQPRMYRHTRTMLKIRSTPTDRLDLNCSSFSLLGIRYFIRPITSSFEFGKIRKFSRLAEQASKSNNKYTVNCIFMQKSRYNHAIYCNIIKHTLLYFDVKVQYHVCLFVSLPN